MKKNYSGLELLALIPLIVAVVIGLYLTLGVIAAGLISLVLWGIGFDSGLGFFQLWMASSAAVFLLSWIGKLLFGSKA